MLKTFVSLFCFAGLVGSVGMDRIERNELLTENKRVKSEYTDIQKKPKIDTNKIKDLAYQKGILSVDTSKYFGNGFNYGKWYVKDSINRHRSIKRWMDDGNILVIDGDHFTISGINSFKKTGKLGSHSIKAEHK